MFKVLEKVLYNHPYGSDIAVILEKQGELYKLDISNEWIKEEYLESYKEVTNETHKE